jgi:hypothetical protein
MPAPKVDPKKYDDHMNRNKKPKNMTSTQKSLAMVRSKMKLSALRRKSMAKESYGKEYQRHQQGLKDAQADMKSAKTNDQMVKAMNKKQFHAKAIQRMNRMESFACCGQCNCDPCTCDQITEKLSVGDGMGAWIDDFKKSDAPQFKGKDDKQRRDMAIAAYLSAKRGTKNEAKKVVITKKMQQRALSKVRAQPKDKVSLPKAPWDKNKKEGYVSAAQRKAVWATRADGGKGHPDKKGKK